jgi:hypothetical protein
MIQIADLVLFAMAKVAYQPSYRPFAALKAAGKLIDCLLPADSSPVGGSNTVALISKKPSRKTELFSAGSQAPTPDPSVYSQHKLLRMLGFNTPVHSFNFSGAKKGFLEGQS